MTPRRKMMGAAVIAATLVAVLMPAQADVPVGVLVPSSGKGASYGQQQQNAINMFLDKYADLGGGIARLLVIALLVVSDPGRHFRLRVGSKEIRAGKHSLCGRATDLDEARIVDADTGDDRLSHALLASFGNRMGRLVVERGYDQPARIERLGARGLRRIVDVAGLK